jgi:hypothetical protein
MPLVSVIKKVLLADKRQMSTQPLVTLIDRLPAGRARRRYQRLLADVGGDTLAVNVARAETIWLTSAFGGAKVLAAQGIPRWRIWTLAEVQDFLSACGTPVKDLREAAAVLQSAFPLGE